MSKSDKKVIWIVNHYSTLPIKDGAGNRHYMLAQGLLKLGWNPVLLLASTKHPSGDQYLAKAENRLIGTDKGVPFLMLRTREYRNGIQRLLNMVEFSLRLLMPRATRGIDRPDVVMGCTVHLLAAWSALLLARKFKVPFVFEVRDIWPETLIDLGKLRNGGLLEWLMRKLSKHLYKNADLIISPLPGVRSHLDELGFEDKSFCWVANGILEIPSSLDVPREDSDQFTFMYLGSHGNANGIKGLLQAFDLACSDLGRDKRLYLKLVGEGPLKAEFETFASTLSSNSNIVFENKISRTKVIDKARTADALVVNIEDLPVYRYGISLNKLFDYMAAGRPTVIASNAVNNPIVESGGGISVSAGNVRALADALIEMSQLPVKQRIEMGENALHHVTTEYSAQALTNRLVEGLKILVKS